MKSSLAKPKTQAGIFKTELHLQHHPPQKTPCESLKRNLAY